MLPNQGTHKQSNQKVASMATIHEDDDDAPPNTEGAEVEVENEADDKGTKEPIIDVIEDDGADERIADQNQDQDDVDEGEKPRRHKESAAERRARAKLAKERDKKELDFQRRELARQDALIKDLQKATTVNRVTELDNRIATANNEASTYDTIHYKAIIAKNEVDAKAAADIRDAAKQRAWEAHQEKQAVIQQAQRAQMEAVGACQGTGGVEARPPHRDAARVPAKAFVGPCVRHDDQPVGRRACLQRPTR